MCQGKTFLRGVKPKVVSQIKPVPYFARSSGFVSAVAAEEISFLSGEGNEQSFSVGLPSLTGPGY